MRKALIAFGLLFVLAVGGMIAIHAEVNEVRNQVVITEEILSGDKAAAEGLTILAQAVLQNGHLSWDTTYTVGAQPQTHTDFKYSNERRDRNVHHEPMGLVLGNTLHRHNSDWTRASDSSNLVGIDLAYWELREETPVGKEGKRNIRVADYYDYYPIWISLEVPGYNLEKTFGEISMARSPEQMDNMEQVYDALENYLKIPVLPGETMSIDLYHTEAGVNSWGSSTGSSVRYDASTYGQSVVTDDACYFVLNNRATDDRIMDFSHVPGGYGIHMLSYQYSPTETGTMVDPDSLRIAYPLDEESRVLWLEHTEENDRLLLITLEANGDTVLRVIECGSMKTLQEITLYEGEDVFYTAICEEDFVAVRSAGNRIILLQERSDGTYDTVIDITVTEEQTVGYGFHTMHWDGEKLVLACPWDQIDWQSGDNCGFGVGVYDKTGALFVAKYTSSLDTKTYSPYSGENCFLWSDDPLHISWK